VINAEYASNVGSAIQSMAQYNMQSLIIAFSQVSYCNRNYGIWEKDEAWESSSDRWMNSLFHVLLVGLIVYDCIMYM